MDVPGWGPEKQTPVLNKSSAFSHGLVGWWPTVVSGANNVIATDAAEGVIPDFSGHGTNLDRSRVSSAGTIATGYTRYGPAYDFSTSQCYLRYKPKSAADPLWISDNYTVCLLAQVSDNDAMLYQKKHDSGSNDDQIWIANGALPEPVRFLVRGTTIGTTTNLVDTGDILFCILSIGTAGSTNSEGHVWNLTQNWYEMEQGIGGSTTAAPDHKIFFGADSDSATNDGEATMGNYHQGLEWGMRFYNRYMLPDEARALFHNHDDIFLRPSVRGFVAAVGGASGTFGDAGYPMVNFG